MTRRRGLRGGGHAVKRHCAVVAAPLCDDIGDAKQAVFSRMLA
jgi:hypothetical protein